MILLLSDHQKIFFTTIEYGRPYHIATEVQVDVTQQDEVLLVCGIANPKPLKQYLAERAYTYYQQDYNDHHIFTIDDLQEIRKKYNDISSENKFILTTEKDAVRLEKFNDQLHDLPLYVLPIQHQFLFEEGRAFDETIIQFVKDFQLNSKKHE